MNKIQETLKDRGSVHGDYEKQATCAQDIKRIIHHHANKGPRCVINPVQQETLDMISVKISRIITGDASFEDHWHDIAGYATKQEETERKLRNKP